MGVGCFTSRPQVNPNGQVATIEDLFISISFNLYFQKLISEWEQAIFVSNSEHYTCETDRRR